MVAALYTIYYVNTGFLVLVILLQSGRGGGLGEFGGGASSTTTFGSRGTSSILQKMTVWSAVLFMVLSLTLAIMSSRHRDVGRGQIVAEDQMNPGVDSQQADTNSLPAGASTPLPDTGDQNNAGELPAPVDSLPDAGDQGDQ